jgi:hypothetical protein
MPADELIAYKRAVKEGRRENVRSRKMTALPATVFILRAAIFASLPAARLSDTRISTIVKARIMIRRITASAQTEPYWSRLEQLDVNMKSMVVVHSPARPL